MDHHLHQQQSRPPSVDSVNLGSIYSGFYPQASSTGPSSLGNNVGRQQQYPSYHQPNPQGQYQTPQYNSLPVSFGGYPNSTYQTQPIQNVPPVPGALPLNINQHYQISAAAAAATAFGMNFQQQQQQQNSNSQTQPIMPTPTFPPQMIQSPPQIPAAASAYVAGGLPPAGAWPLSPTNNSDYLTQYYSQYYREYYQRYVTHQKRIQQELNQKKIAPYKYNRFHTPAIFSQHDNRLMVVEANARLALYGLQEVFTEQCYPQLFLQSLLFNRESAPDSSASITGPSTMLPFNDPQVALDWIRIKQLNDSAMNYELKLILKVITMLFRQNGAVSGLDLSELLYELVTHPTGDDSVEKLSNSGSEAITKDYYREMLAHLRQLLMRGQRWVAITYAQNNGLFDHAMALSYLLSFLPAASVNGGSGIGQLGHVIDNGLLISTIRKFIASTLSNEDPLYVFYSHLLQVATNVVNAAATESGTTPAAPTTQSSAKIDRLESFIILLANDIKFDRVEIADKSYRNLIDLMIALLKDDYNYVLPDELFNNDRFDGLLVNECLEFARFHGNRLNPRLILRKLEFAFELFEFGFSRHSINYLTKIKEKILDPELDWKLLIDSKSRYRKYLLPESTVNLESDPEDAAAKKKLLQSIWLYQMAKILTRINVTNDFHSPLFSQPELEEEKTTAPADIEEDETDTRNKNDTVEEEDKTEDDIEEEEEEELTSESSLSNRHDQSLSGASQPPVEQHQPVKTQQKQQNSTMMPSVDGQVTPSLEKLPINSMSPIENHTNMMGMPQTPPSMVPRRSLPNVQNLSGRTLNPIMEIPGPLESNSHQIEPGDDNASFKMNQMQNALTSHPEEENNHNTNQEPTSSFSQQQQFQPMLFQPPPPTVDQNSVTAPPPFDFVSNGRVSSIPVYDPFMAKETGPVTPSGADIPPMNHKNNEFLLNNNSGANQSSNYENSHHQENNRHQEAAEKSSPSKANQGGGLLNAILGRLKPKNQMILPDDSDPQIVFDPVTKRWVDKSSGSQQDGPVGPPPPPKIPFGNVGPGSTQSEPNSAVTSPVHQLPTMPTFSSGLNSLNLPPPSNMASQNDPMAPISNGSVPSANTTAGPVQQFGVAPPPPPSGNTFRTDIRRKRYIDVFNQTR